MAMPAYITRDVDGSSWRRSKVRARPDAAFACVNDDGHLRTDRSRVAATGPEEVIAVREKVRVKFCPIIGPIKDG